ncbi:MAG: phytoene dehydrogenase, partial [Pirellulaceae bacterium]|nr:phytoene dehydrogenase [Pirellulaceae bacterium]
RGPLARLLKQLRFRWDDFSLAPQIGSLIAFPDHQLKFNNDIGTLKQEITEKFPGEIDNFNRLISEIIDYDDLSEEAYTLSARTILEETISDPLLIEMLLCPLMWYGNAREDDMDFAQFCIMFRSIYLEGFARPFAGVRLILKNLVRKFRGLGGELKLRAGVEKITVEDGRAVGVILDDGRELSGRRVLSSAGWVETMRMCDDISEADVNRRAGKLSFTECVSILDKQPKQLGCDKTIIFYNDSDTFHWRQPDEDLCDLRTGVICSPNNFAYNEASGQLPDGVVRITSLADFRGWTALDDDDYRLQKLRWHDAVVHSAVRFMPDFRNHVIDTDMFTPKTIRRFTWHDNGAVYGAPDKQVDGCTHLSNLFVCGTDQGFVGIIGAIVSGISIANQHLLRE